MRYCHRCNERHSLCPIANGDIIIAGRGVPLREGPSESLGVDAAATQTEMTDSDDIALPDDFTERVRRQATHTPWHIPESLRL